MFYLIRKIIEKINDSTALTLAFIVIVMAIVSLCAFSILLVLFS